MGGQAIGELDVNALLSYDGKNIIKELFTARSDNLKTKRQMIRDLRETGSTFMSSWQDDASGQTNKLFNIYMLGSGLFSNI